MKVRFPSLLAERKGLIAVGALAFASWIGAAYPADSNTLGAQIFERHCRTCHGGAVPADLPIGPDVRGVIGRKAGTHHTGVSSRALQESGIVWDRDSLRRFLSSPSTPMPDNHAAFGRDHPNEVEGVLDYLESVRDPDRNPTPLSVHPRPD